MAKETPAQQETVERVMHEFKHGDLKQRSGARVRNPKQAIAIALHEAGASNQENPSTNRRNLARTKRNERAVQAARDTKEGRGAADQPTRAELYPDAKRTDLPGRSKMSKAELAHALRG